MRNLFLFFLIAAFFISCSDSGNKEQTQKENANISSSKNKTTAVTGPMKILKYNYTPGDIINYKLTTEMNSLQSIESDTLIMQEIVQKVKYVFQLKVLTVDKNDIAEIEIKTKSIVADANINGEKMKYDSKYIYSTRERMMFADYEAIKGKSYIARISPKGDILEIKGAESIVKELLSIQGREQKLSKEQFKTFERNFIDQGIAPVTQQLFKSTTDKKVGINSTWEQRYPSILGGFNIENIATFKVQSFEVENGDSLAKLLANLTVSWTGQNQLQEKGVRYTFSDPIISGFGTIYFNVTKGCVQKSNSTIRMEMEMTMESFDENQNPIKALKRDVVESKNTLTRI